MAELSTESTPVLAYSFKYKLERAAVKWLGILGLAISVPSIGRLVLEVVMMAFMHTPGWFRVAVNVERQTSRGRSTMGTGMLVELWEPMIFPVLWPLVNLLLLAGSIGCLRRYARTRWWMISYGWVCISVILVTLLCDLLVESHAIRQGFSFFNYWSMAKVDRLAGASLGGLSDAALKLAFPVMAIWVMTRKNVIELFAERPEPS